MGVALYCLWHLDGHHSTLKSRACAVPQMFSEFVGFNCPERYKGMKRGPESLCGNILQVHSQALLEVAQQPWLHSSKWKGILASLNSLAESLNKYSLYLSKKNTEVAENHMLLSPVRQATTADGASLSESMIVIPKAQYVKPAIATHHTCLQSTLSSSVEYTPVYLNDILPADRRYRKISIYA